MFAAPILRFAANRIQKARAAKKTENTYNHLQGGPLQPSNTPSRPTHFHPLVIIPLVITSIALIFSLLCIFAGHTTSMMQDYGVFTLNTTRIGENVVHKLEDKIRSFDLSDLGLGKRDAFIVLPATAKIAPPSTLITMAPIAKRVDIGSLYSKATHHVASDVKSLKSKGKGEFSEATSLIHSKITSAESAVAGEAASVIEDVENGLIKLINQACTGFIEDLDIQGFYNVHVMASCKGTYVFQNGTNVTVGNAGYPTLSGPDSVHQRVDSCEQHSAVDPMSLIRIIYWVSVVHTIASYLTSIWALLRGCSRKLFLVNLLLTLFASITMALVSLVVHGLALAATKVINFLGAEIGVSASLGHKFLAMTWATTGLLTLNLLVWTAIYYVQKRRGTGTNSRPKLMEEYPMHNISRPEPAHMGKRF